MADKPEPTDGTLVRSDMRVAHDAIPTLVREAGPDPEGTLAPGADADGTLVRGREGASEEGPVTPETPGRYLLKSEVGRGGQSRVLLAIDAHLGREIALKELLVESPPGERETGAPVSQTAAAAARFLREARITGQLEHPNIVPVYELGQHADGAYYYTQKLVRGASFKTALGNARTLPERLKLLSHFADVCHAVAYAHSRGVIHRDLKPENVVLGEFGETVLLDWGLAKARGQQDLEAHKVAREALALRSPDQTVEGHALGTPSYMSPEQALGKLDQIDERSDVWSLGAILYEILTGEPPFRGDTAYSVIGKVIKDPVRPVRALLPGAPPELAAVAERALSRDKALRYPSASELAQEIEAFQAGRNVAAYAYSSLELFKRFVQKNRALSVVSAFSLLLILAALVAVAREYRTAQLYLGEARAALNEAHGNLAQAFLEKARAAERDLLWHRAEIFYAAARVQHDGPEARWGILVEGEDASGVMRISGPAGDLHAVRFAPSGETCATGSSDGTVRIFSLDTGRELWRFQAPAGIESVAWSDDGTLLASRDAEGAVRVHEVRSGAQLASASCAQARGSLAFAGTKLYASCSQGTLVLSLPSAGATVPSSGAGNPTSGAANTSHGAAPSSGAADHARAAGSAPGPVETSHGGAAERLAPSERVAACGGKVWIAQPGELSALDGTVSLQLPEGRHELSCGGARVAASLDDRTIRVWDDRGLLRATLRGHADVITHLALSPDGARLASTSEDRTVRLWDVATGGQIAMLQRPARTLWVDFDADGRNVAVGEQQSAVLLWDVSPGEQGVSGELPEFTFLPDGGFLAAGESGVIGRWTADARLATRLQDDGPIAALALAPGAGEAAAVLASGKVHVWDLATRRLARRIVASAPARKAIYAGSRLVADLGGRLVFLEPESPLAALDGPVEQWSVPAGGAALVALVAGRLLRLELPSGRKLPALEVAASAIALSPRGDTLAVGTYGKVLLLEASTLRPLGELPLQGAVPLSLAFSPDGALLAASGMNGAVRLFETASRREVEDLPVAAARLVRGLSFSPDGRRLRLETVGSTSTLGGVRFVRLNDPATLPDPQRGLEQVLREHGVALDGTELVEVPPAVIAR